MEKSDNFNDSIEEESINSTTALTDLKPKKSVLHKFKNPKDLLMSVNAVVKNRTGSVLNRGMILKSDHFETGVNPKLDIHLQGFFFPSYGRCAQFQNG
jgi:hypothetical protein